MESCGTIGHSELIGFYADGDGDFHPRFKFLNHQDSSVVEPKLEDYALVDNAESVKIFDAG